MIMIIVLLKFVVYLSFTFLAGFAVLNFFPLKKLKPPFYIKLSWAYLLGVGAITWWMFVLSNFTSFSILKIIAPWLLIFGYKFHKNYNDHKKNHHSWLPKPMMIRLTKQGMFFIFLIFLQLIFIIYQALSRESLAFDALNNWVLKAKVFFIEKRVNAEIFTNQIHLTNGILVAHERRELHYLQDYPLLIPLNVTFLFLTLGRVDLIILKLIWVLFYTILIVNFNYFLKFFATRLSIFFTFLLTTIPYFYEEVVGKYAPYADLALSEFIFIGVMFFVLAKKMNDKGLLLLGFLLISFSGWIKNEGLIPLFLAVAVFFIMARQMKLNLRYGFIPAIINLPWWFYMRFYGIKSTTVFFDKFNHMEDFVNKLLLAGRVFISQLFDPYAFNIIWWLFFALLLYKWKKNYQTIISLPVYFIFFELIVLYVFHLVTINEPYNFQRLIFVFVPLALFSIAIMVSERRNYEKTII